MKKSRIIVIVGPNASGKSEYGVKLAKKIGGEIISADSRQVYKGLNIGSGKITKKEMRSVPHHCLDIADPKKVFTADDFRKCAQKAITDILSRGKTPIIVGGTGFYIDAALGRTKLAGIPPNPKLRKNLSQKSAVALLKMLKKLDPNRAKTIEQKNPRRLIRAIEIARHRETNALSSREEAKSRPRESLASATARARGIFQQKNIRAFKGAHSLPTTWIGIKRSPEELKKRIHKRLLARLPGIIREVKKLHHDGVSWKRLYDLGLEYRYASLYLRGKLDKNQLTSQLENSIKRYAKRQMTWFKKNKEIRWIKPKK